MNPTRNLQPIGNNFPRQANRNNQPNPPNRLNIENNLRDIFNVIFEPAPFMINHIGERIHVNHIHNEFFGIERNDHLTEFERENRLIAAIEEEIQNQFNPREIIFNNAFVINRNRLQNIVNINIHIEPIFEREEANDFPPETVPVQNFLNNRQNTHLSSITTSVTESILKLKERYVHKSGEEIAEDKILLSTKSESIQSEIDEFLVTCTLYHHPGKTDEHNLRENQLRKEIVSGWFHYISALGYDTEIHAASGLKLKEILALVWHGVIDKHAFPDGSGITELSDEDISLRKTTLLKNIYEAQKEHVCFMGNINAIVSSLDLCHPDVVIQRFSPTELEHFAKTTSQEHMFSFIKEKLSQLHPARKALVLSDWDTEGSFFTEFMQTIKHDNSLLLRNFLMEKLNENYGPDVTNLAKTNIVNEMISSLDDIPRISIE